jgi:penicillin-binding protein 2A
MKQLDRYGLKEEDVMNKGLKIYTTLDQNYQSALQDTFEESWNFPSNASDGTKAQGASVAMDPKTGAVRAIVGGRGQHVFRGYNRATQMKRQPGSTMKPLAVYSPALQMVIIMIQSFLINCKNLVKTVMSQRTLIINTQIRFQCTKA